jgi:hypothetical protein
MVRSFETAAEKAHLAGQPAKNLLNLQETAPAWNLLSKNVFGFPVTLQPFSKKESNQPSCTWSQKI